MFPHVPRDNAQVGKDDAIQRINEAVSAAGLNPAEIARQSGVDYGTVRTFLTGKRKTYPTTVRQIEAVIPDWPAGRFASLLADAEATFADEPATPTNPPTILTLPEQVVDGLAIPELEELRADLVARSYTKSAEIRSRPGRRSGYGLAAHRFTGAELEVAEQDDHDQASQDNGSDDGA